MDLTKIDVDEISETETVKTARIVKARLTDGESSLEILICDLIDAYDIIKNGKIFLTSMPHSCNPLCIENGFHKRYKDACNACIFRRDEDSPDDWPFCYNYITDIQKWEAEYIGGSFTYDEAECLENLSKELAIFITFLLFLQEEFR